MPRFGHPMLAEWAFDPAVTYLNHGTVGATPRRVLAAQQAIRDEMERQPARFMLREFKSQVGVPVASPSKVRRAADQVAAFLGAAGNDLVFVDNATAACGAVLRSLDLDEGDEILLTDQVYGGVERAARYAARLRGARVVTVELPWPVTDPAEIVAAVAGALTPRTKVAVLEQIAASTSHVYPLAELAAACRARGVPVLADGAHAPGAIPVDIPALGVDWYAGNLHKWAWAPRSSGILWARPELQAALHPPVISWGLDLGFTEEFDWVGTRDPSTWLAAPAGIAFMRELGAEAVQRYNHDLAWQAARLLTTEWGTPLETIEAMVGTMVTIPLPGAMGSTAEEGQRLRDQLLFEDNIEVQLHDWRNRLWVRVSGQVYNEMSDVEKLAAAVGKRRPG